MDIYSLKTKELNELYDEFNKTDFGRRAKIFSVIPLWSAILSFVIYVVEDFVYEGGRLFLGMTILNISLFAIAQLQYGNMLKDYISSKKAKNKKE